MTENKKDNDSFEDRISRSVSKGAMSSILKSEEGRGEMPETLPKIDTSKLKKPTNYRRPVSIRADIVGFYENYATKRGFKFTTLINLILEEYMKELSGKK